MYDFLLFFFVLFDYLLGGILCEGFGDERGCIFLLIYIMGWGDICMYIYHFLLKKKEKQKEKDESTNEQITHPHSPPPPKNLGRRIIRRPHRNHRPSHEHSLLQKQQ